MRVRMKTTACGPNLNLNAGQVYDLPAKMAEDFIRGRYAEVVEEGQPATATTSAHAATETATAPPAEERAVVETPQEPHVPAHTAPPAEVVEEGQPATPATPPQTNQNAQKKKGPRG